MYFKNREIDENAIVEAMLDALDVLAERIQEYGLFESENDSLYLDVNTRTR